VPTSRLRESALAVLREAHWAAKALRVAERQKAVERATKEFAALFRRQGRLYMEQFPKLASLFVTAQVQEASYEPDLVDAFTDVFGTTRAQAEQAMFNSLFEGVVQGYEALAGDFGLESSFKIKPERAVSWARDNAAVKVTQINEATEKTINEIIVRGLNKGKSYGEVGREIKGRFAEFAEGRPQAHIRSRAELVAVQENAMAFEAGQSSLVEDIEAAGITMEKSIGGPVDDRTSDDCMAAMDMGWIPTDEAFPNGAMTAPIHVACRHDTRYRIKREGADAISN
jgi:hypothetical protein